MLNKGDDGSEAKARYSYPSSFLPDSYQFIDMWHSYRRAVSPYDEWEEDEYITLHAKPPLSGKDPSYTPVMVLTDENAQGIHRK